MPVRSVFSGNRVTLQAMENNFAETISNEELAEMPVCSFGGEIIVVDTVEMLEIACKELSKHNIIGFDTETRPTFKPGALNKVALLQLSDPGRCYLFRLCKIPMEKPLSELLENKNILKIGADVKNDLHGLQQLRRFSPEGFVDLQSIVPQWGISDKSVRKMAGIILGSRVSKAQRLSNWEASTLTPAQNMYAATDAWVCERMYRKLLDTDKRPLTQPEPADVRDKPAKKSRKKRYGWKRKTSVATAETGLAEKPGKE